MTQPSSTGGDDAFAAIVENFHNTVTEEDHAGGGAEAALVLTELGFTERFIRKYEGKFLFVPNVGWHTYRDGRWDFDEMNEVLNATRFLTDKIQREHLDGELIGVTEAELRGVIRSVSKIGTRRAILAAAEVDPRMKVSVVDLNRDPWSLNVGNGTLDLKTGTRRDWDPADRITQRANVEWDEHAECPRFDALLSHAFPGAEGEEMIRYLWRVIGYSLTGVTSAQAFFFLWGVKGSSKSTITECLVEMLGGYAHMLNEYALVGSEQQHPTWIVDLIGKRMVVKDELDKRKRINTARLNSMVGGAKQRARKMARDEVDVPMSGKIWITTNPRPPMGDGSDGVWRRIHPVEFKHAIPKDEMVPDYGKMLAVEEGAGILRKAVEALWEVLELGGGVVTFRSLGVPQAVSSSAEEYQQLDDEYGDFLGDCFEITGDQRDFIGNEDIMRLHKDWCEAANVKPMTQVALGKALTALGLTRTDRGHQVAQINSFTETKRKKMRGYFGVKVADGADANPRMRWFPVQNLDGTVPETVPEGD